MTNLPHSSVRAPRAHPALACALRLALLALPLGVLVACGGGEEEEAVAGPTLVRVDAPPSTPADSTSSGTERSGTLNYRVWGSADVETQSETTASADVEAVEYPYKDRDVLGDLHYYDTSITLAPSNAFTAGLQITDAYRKSLKWHVQNSSGSWVDVDAGSGGVSSAAISHEPFDSIGLLGKGNFFVFCAAGSTNTTSAQSARTGAQVAVSGNFVPMDNVAALYGKSFRRFDCTGTTNRTTFGDGKGHLTMAFDGMSLSEAQTVQAFSSAGYTPASGQVIKRRAYSMVINGTTRYVVVALDNRGSPYQSYASVLYQLEN